MCYHPVCVSCDDSPKLVKEFVERFVFCVFHRKYFILDLSF